MRPVRAIFTLASWAAILASNSGICAEPPPSPAKGTPRIVVQAPMLDLGKVSRGQLAEARFEVRNEGDAVLNILEAKPG